MNAIPEDKYPVLSAFARPLLPAEGKIVGREAEVNQVLASLYRPVMSNVALLGPAGSGKTSLVRAVMELDKSRIYLEVDLARLAGSATQRDHTASLVKEIFDEAERYAADQETELVLFIDEFHQLVLLSPLAVEAVKPVLADSGARGLRIIAATTSEEWHQYITANQALTQRLPLIILNPATREMVIEMLRNLAESAGALDSIPADFDLFGKIYDLTELYLLSAVQPRKSLTLLDSMIGKHRQSGAPMDESLLADSLRVATGNDIDFQADGRAIAETLNSKVYDQKLAVRSITGRIQIAVAKLGDPHKPKGRFLFTGSTGVGKAVSVHEPVPVYNETYGVRWTSHGELVPGDKVFNRQGQPVEVLATFPQGVRDLYDVDLADGRWLRVDGEHLFGVYVDGGDTLETLTVNQMLADGREYCVPMNGAVERPARACARDPFTVGREGLWDGVPTEVSDGSIAQRTAYLEGLRAHSKFRGFSCNAAKEVQATLFSLGVSSVVDEYSLPNGDARWAVVLRDDQKRVPITSITKLEERGETVCIYIDDEEHLYLAGRDYMVTHNTEMAKQLAQLLFGDIKTKFISFDMAEYALPDSIDAFRSRLTDRVSSVGEAVVLFDEIEKADRSVARLLLSVLDDGRLNDDHGRPVNFLSCYFIMTTNAGGSIYEQIGPYLEDEDGSGGSMADYQEVIERALRDEKFSSEILGRLDRVIPFKPLNDATKAKVVHRALGELRDRMLYEHGVKIEIMGAVLDYLTVDLGRDAASSGGARESIRALNNNVTEILADYVLHHPEQKNLVLGIDGQMRAESTSTRVSKAKPFVRPKLG